MPDYVELEIRHNEWTLWHMDGSTVKADYCPFCGKKLDQENYAKGTAAMYFSAMAGVSIEGANGFVDMLIAAVKHELK